MSLETHSVLDHINLPVREALKGRLDPADMMWLSHDFAHHIEPDAQFLKLRRDTQRARDTLFERPNSDVFLKTRDSFFGGQTCWTKTDFSIRHIIFRRAGKEKELQEQIKKLEREIAAHKAPLLSRRSDVAALERTRDFFSVLPFLRKNTDSLFLSFFVVRTARPPLFFRHALFFLFSSLRARVFAKERRSLRPKTLSLILEKPGKDFAFPARSLEYGKRERTVL